MKKVKLGALRALYNKYSCTKWRERIAPYLHTYMFDPDTEEITINEEDVKAASAATDEQKADLTRLGILDKNLFLPITELSDILNKSDKVLELSKELFNNNSLDLCVYASDCIKRPDLRGRAFFVGNNIEVITHTIGEGGTIIELKRK